MPERDTKRVEHDPVLTSALRTPMTHLSFVIHNHATRVGGRRT